MFALIFPPVRQIAIVMKIIIQPNQIDKTTRTPRVSETYKVSSTRWIYAKKHPEGSKTSGTFLYIVISNQSQAQGASVEGSSPAPVDSVRMTASAESEKKGGSFVPVAWNTKVVRARMNWEFAIIQFTWT